MADKSESKNNLKKHNNFFLSSMSNVKVVRDFFETHIPAGIKKKLDFESLVQCKETYISNELKNSQVDVLYRINLNDQPSYIYCLAEHQSTCDLTMAFRMHEYAVKIMAHHVSNQKEFKLPIVLKFVLYHGRVSYYGSTDIFDLFGENKELAQQTFLKPFTLIDVTKMEDSELMRSNLAGTMKFIYKHIYAREITHYLEAIAKQLQYLEKTDDTYLTNILQYVILQGETEQKEKIVNFIENTFSQDTGNKMANIAEQFKQEGIQIGEARVRAEADQKLSETIATVVTNLHLAGQSQEFISQVTKVSITKVQEIISNITKH